VLGEKDVLPADGSPSEQQVGRADQGQGLRAKLSSSIPGRKPYMDLLDQPTRAVGKVRLPRRMRGIASPRAGANAPGRSRNC
jgi:hypothetical protein